MDITKMLSGLSVPAAIAEQLRERFAQLKQQHSFVPGDLVIGKPGLCKVKDELADRPRIVVDTDLTGYPPAQPYESGDVVDRFDIAVMDIDQRLGTALIRLEDSRVLMPWQPMPTAPAVGAEG